VPGRPGERGPTALSSRAGAANDDGMTAPVMPVLAVGPDGLLIDALMPRCDADLAEHTIVHAPAAATYRAARELDFVTIHTPLLDSAMWLRGLPGRITGTEPPPPPRLVPAEQTGALPGWVVLGEQPDREFAFGAIGRFWTPSIEWRDVPPTDFADFAEPGWGKIVVAFVVSAYGAGSLLTYECRTLTGDPASRARFLRYWRLIRPFAAHIFRATVAQVRRNAERGDS
jgi:hypothetical protein